jgi:hypothetical protein
VVGVVVARPAPAAVVAGARVRRQPASRQRVRHRPVRHQRTR